MASNLIGFPKRPRKKNKNMIKKSQKPQWRELTRILATSPRKSKNMALKILKKIKKTLVISSITILIKKNTI